MVQTHRVGLAGNPRRRLMRRRGSGATHSRLPGDGGAPLAGITTCRQELADRRGWSTFSEARPAHRYYAARGAPGGAALLTKGGGAFAKRPTGWLRRPSIGGFAKPPRLPALRSPRGSVMRRETRACPGPTKEYGRRSIGSLTIESMRRAGARHTLCVMRGLGPRIHDECRRRGCLSPDRKKHA